MIARRLDFARAALLAALVVIAAFARAAPEDRYARLVEALTTDDAFKVRMQALRILGKKLRAQQGPPPGPTLAAIARAATDDEDHLVRGLACFILGQLRDVRARAALVQAGEDKKAFVRAQASVALGQLGVDAVARGVASDRPRPGRRRRRRTPTRPGAAPGAAPDTGLPALVVAVERMPGVAVPDRTLNGLRAGLKKRVRAGAGDNFIVGRGERGGFRLAGSIALRQIDQTGGRTRITVVVRIMIATWPGNNLRHVISARASAATRARYPAAIERLEGKVLDAAVTKAVADAMAELLKT